MFLDGDCVPFRDYVAVHRAHFQPHSFCTGGYVRLTLEQSRTLTVEDVRAGRHERLMGSANWAELKRTHRKNRLYALINRKDEPKILGGNLSVAREALFGINGFEEEYNGFSKSDSDVRNRLRNAGSKGISLWTRAFVCHLDHKLDERRCRPGVLRSRQDREVYLTSKKRVKARKGLDSHAPTSQ